MGKNSIYINETRERNSKKALRNHILKIVSEYKDTDKSISSVILTRIYIDALFLKEVNYIKYLIKKCKKNMPTEYLELFEEHVKENTITQNGGKNSSEDAYEAKNLIGNESNEEMIIDQGGVPVTYTEIVEDISNIAKYTDNNIPKLYNFSYIVKAGDTFDSLCKKFNLSSEKQNIQSKVLVEDDLIILYTDDEIMAKYQQAIFEYVNSSKYSRKK